MKIQRNLLLAALAITLAGCHDYTPVQTFTEAPDPVAPTSVQVAQWEDTSKGLHVGWASPHRRYSRSLVPVGTTREVRHLVAWRGEKVSAQLLLWNADHTNGVKCVVDPFISDQHQLSAGIAQTRFVRYTLSDKYTHRFTKGGPQVLAPDMLDSLARFDMDPRTTRPVWLTIQVPADAQPGVYNSQVIISYNGRSGLTLPLQLEVLDHTLPSPREWGFHLDLWQHPAAVARAQGLELWSDAHFAALRESMTTLANAGQKVITATLNKDPWNHQCYDAYEDMIRWTHHKDGSWSFDYSVFDRWVELMMSLGIDRMINCYSMVPWNCELHFMDEAKGEQVTVVAEPGKPEFNQYWTPFLLDFKRHLTAKGWLSITNIAMDERSPQAMDAAVKLLMKCAPEMGFAIADNHKSYKRYSMMRDVCVAQEQSAIHEDILQRRQQGYNTTFYVCCGPLYPNTFTCSQPYESELLGWYAVASDYDGMLRWAYNSWPADPQYDARYGNWTAGDTYLIYPYNRSSIRFERLIDGIEVYEKIHLLRQSGADMSGLELFLKEMQSMNVNDDSQPWMQMVEKGNEILNECSRRN